MPRIFSRRFAPRRYAARPYGGRYRTRIPRSIAAGIQTNPAGFITRYNPTTLKVHPAIRTRIGADVFTAATPVAKLYIFDPAGGATITPPTGWIFPSVGPAMPGWTEFIALYQQYKVKKIRCNFVLTTLEGTDAATLPEMWIRHLANADQTTVSTTLFEDATNSTHVLFNNDSRMAQIDIYPKQRLQGYGGNGSSSVYLPQDWTDCTNVAELFGLALYIPVLATGQSVRMDVEYHVDFKEQI